MQITHLGHACLLIEAAGQRVLIDPGTLSTFADVTGLDLVLVTHQHADHLDPDRFGALLAANPAAQVWLEPQTADRQDADAPHAGRVQRMAAGQVIDLGELSIEPVGSLHAQIHPYVDRINNLGLVLRAPGEPSLFHPGDALDADPGPVDVLCAPLSAPWSRVADTLEFVRRIAAPRVVPIHDGTLSEAGRTMYLGHVRSFGSDGGQDVLDLRGAGPTSL